jgi:5-methylcytosine-specific restriction endonuclease McrA
MLKTRNEYQIIRSTLHPQCVQCGEDCRKHPRCTYLQFSRQKFCSSKCKAIWQSHNWQGPLNANYSHGNSKLNDRIRGSARYRKWRREVFRRDRWTCQKCNQRGVTINADHIKPFALYPKLRFSLSNGRTLCEPCHKSTPTYGASKARLRQANL